MIFLSSWLVLPLICAYYLFCKSTFHFGHLLCFFHIHPVFIYIHVPRCPRLPHTIPTQPVEVEWNKESTLWQQVWAIENAMEARFFKPFSLHLFILPLMNMQEESCNFSEGSEEMATVRGNFGKRQVFWCAAADWVFQQQQFGQIYWLHHKPHKTNAFPLIIFRTISWAFLDFTRQVACFHNYSVS